MIHVVASVRMSIVVNNRHVGAHERARVFISCWGKGATMNPLCVLESKLSTSCGFLYWFNFYSSNKKPSAFKSGILRFMFTHKSIGSRCLDLRLNR